MMYCPKEMKLLKINTNLHHSQAWKSKKSSVSSILIPLTLANVLKLQIRIKFWIFQKDKHQGQVWISNRLHQMGKERDLMQSPTIPNTGPIKKRIKTVMTITWHISTNVTFTILTTWTMRLWRIRFNSGLIWKNTISQILAKASNHDLKVK